MVDGLCRAYVQLFDDINFGGSFRTLIASLADFRAIEFNDRASSAIVIPAPDFTPGSAIRLWSDINFTGVPLDMGPGQYPDLRAFNFNDVASSMSCIQVAGVTVVAQDVERFTVSFNLQVIPPPGTTVIAVQQNTVSNIQATGRFTGPTTVTVTGSFIDRIVVTLRTATGATQTAVGTATVPFSKVINFPQLAGVSLADLSIAVAAQNPAVATTPSGNFVGKTVQFDLTTQVLRGATASSLSVHPDTGEEVETFEVALEVEPE